ncbi:MAG: hypothetical protein LBI42_14650 [Chitinispirillales bacterium]|jgi:hypothetical protein|nr:hypothetical protein [Chitinispirillales bacterium]
MVPSNVYRYIVLTAIIILFKTTYSQEYFTKYKRAYLTEIYVTDASNLVTRGFTVKRMSNPDHTFSRYAGLAMYGYDNLSFIYGLEANLPTTQYISFAQSLGIHFGMPTGFHSHLKLNAGRFKQVHYYVLAGIEYHIHNEDKISKSYGIGVSVKYSARKS